MNKWESRCSVILAALLWTLVLLKSVFCVDESFDSWWYHLPFAARLVGLSGPTEYQMGKWLESCYAGFPICGELVQGLFWRTTGRVESAALATSLSLLAFVWWSARAFKVPFSSLTIMLLSVPLVQIHATRCHVDLFAGIALAGFLSGLLWLTLNGPLSVRQFLGLQFLGIVATNSKFFCVPVYLIGMFFLAGLLLRRGPQGVCPGLGRIAIIGLSLTGMLLAGGTYFKNWIVLGNPVYPVQIRVFGKQLPGTANPQPRLPLYMQGLPAPALWALSVSELDLAIRGRFRPTIWPYSLAMSTGDEGQGPEARGARTGGFFGPTVVLHLGLLSWLSWKLGRRVRPVFFLFLGITGLTTVLPNCFELRYALFWILFLFNLNWALIKRLPDHSILERWLVRYHILCLLALLAWSHLEAFRSFHWSRTPFVSAERFRQHYTDPGVLQTLQTSGPDVLLVGFTPFAFLYSNVFQSSGPRHRIETTELDEKTPRHPGQLVLINPASAR